MSSTATAVTDGHVPFWEKVAYSTGDLAFNLVYVAVGTYLMFFYTEVAGISAATVGTIFLAARLLDGVWDLAVGALMERVHSKYGKARPWILYLAIPYGISAVLLFTAPSFSSQGKVIYAFVTYLLSDVILYTAMNIPYGALNALMSDDQTERGILNTFRMIAAYIGAIIIAALTLPIVKAFGDDAKAWTITFGLYSILAVALFFIVFKFCKERVGYENPSWKDTGTVPQLTEQQPVSLGKGVASLLRNKYWLLLVVFGVLLQAEYALMAIYPYYAKYLLGNEDFASLLFTFRNIIEMAGVFLTIPFIRRIGKRNITFAGCIALVLGQIVIALKPGSLTVILIGLGLAGLGVGAMFGVIFAMIADTIEYEQWRSGVRMEGPVYAGASFGQKVGSAIGGVIVGWLLSLGGYIEHNGNVAQPASALAQIHFIFVWLPMIFGIAMAICMLFYRLDKEYPQILADLDAHKSAGSITADDIKIVKENS